ncbi:MAG: glycosyltransferase family 4 protein [Bacilli bacterium]|nr:glycosyltransferase family 4 protein [Bacilli bacterium]
MNLLYISEDYPTSKVHHELLTRFNLYDINVNLFTVVRLFDKENDLRKKYGNINYKIYSYDLPKKYRLLYRYWFGFKKAFKYSQLIKQINPKEIDYIYAATLFSDGCIAYELNKRYQIPYSVAVRGTDINLYLKKMPHLWNLGRRILLNANKIVFITDNIRNQFANRVPIKGIWNLIRGKTVTINNGIDNFWINNRYFAERSKNPSKILFVGRFNKNKNVEKLIEAVLKLRPLFPDIQLTLVGGGDSRHQAVLKLCEEHPNVIKYLGKIYDKTELMKIYRDHDIFAMVSHSETFGLVFIEALSQNLPVLYTSGQGIDGGFQNNVGESVLSNNVDDISNGLRKLITNLPKYDKIENVIDQFSWDNIAKRYKNILIN